MPKYTPEELKAFEEKDVRIAKEAALKNIAVYIAAGVVKYEDKFKEADLELEYIYLGQGMGNKGQSDRDEKDLVPPTPSPVEKVILAKIMDRYADLTSTQTGVVVSGLLLQKKIIENFGKYPTKEASIDKVVSTIHADELLIPTHS